MKTYSCVSEGLNSNMVAAGMGFGDWWFLLILISFSIDRSSLRSLHAK